MRILWLSRALADAPFAHGAGLALRFSWMLRSILLGAVLLLVLSSGFASRLAYAETPVASTIPVYVLAIWTDDADDQADALTRALRSRVRQTPGWSLQETNQSFETLAIALKCPPRPDLACLLRIGDQLRASHYVWGTMEKKRGAAGEVTTALHMWTRGKPGIETRGVLADGLKDPNDEALRSVAADLFAQLAAAAAPQTISTAGVAPGGAPIVVVTGAGTPRPGTSDAEPSAAADTAARPESKFTARTALAYSTLAVGVGLLAAATVEAANWISDSNASTDDRKTVPATVSDVCAERQNVAAVDACNKSSDATKASALGWVFAGAGAGLVATGIWLVVTEHPGKKASDEASTASRSRFDLVPSLGPRSGSVGVRITF
jgi:hypothetical protein